MLDDSKMLEINRAYWDAAAQVHGNGDDNRYDLEALLAGRDSLSEAENAVLAEAVPSVGGLDVLHVQCHIGFDTVSLARRGARITGVDLSPASLRKAEELSRRCGVTPTYVEADVNALPESLWGRFDLAFASVGVIFFASDMTRWMESVGRCLRPGGKVVLVEFHPFPGLFSSYEPARAWCPYQDLAPEIFDDGDSYASPSAAPAVTTGAVARHTLGTVVTAAARAGLRVEYLTEPLENDRPDQIAAGERTDGRWRVRVGGQPVPLLFGLVARRDPGGAPD